MTQTTIFKSNKSQAVRLPKAVALPDHVKRVDVLVQGNARLIVPAGGSWKDFFDGPRIDEDFLNDRAQPLPQHRNES
jgi:antitoxin VapB